MELSVYHITANDDVLSTYRNWQVGYHSRNASLLRSCLRGSLHCLISYLLIATVLIQQRTKVVPRIAEYMIESIGIDSGKRTRGTEPRQVPKSDQTHSCESASNNPQRGQITLAITWLRTERPRILERIGTHL